MRHCPVCYTPLYYCKSCGAIGCMHADSGQDCTRRKFTAEMRCLRCDAVGRIRTYEQLSPVKYPRSGNAGKALPFSSDPVAERTPRPE